MTGHDAIQYATAFLVVATSIGVLVLAYRLWKVEL